VTAGIVALTLLEGVDTYRNLEAKGKTLENGLRTVLAKHRIKAVINRFGSMMTVFFGVERVMTPDEARKCDRKRFSRFFHGMLNRGVYLPPAPFEAMFVSLAHTISDLNKTIGACDDWAKRETAG
jgi:glutamate-1-semialdehyde 2,1-aminomutase